MDKLERLYKLKSEVCKEIEEIKLSNKALENKIKVSKNTSWYKMFDDLMTLKKYSKYMDTGIPSEQQGSYRETWGFQVDRDSILFVTFRHYGGVIGTKVEWAIFRMYKDRPFEVNSHYSYKMTTLLEILKDWDSVLENIKNNLADKLEEDTNKKVHHMIKSQEILNNEIMDWC